MGLVRFGVLRSSPAGQVQRPSANGDAHGPFGRRHR